MNVNIEVLLGVVVVSLLVQTMVNAVKRLADVETRVKFPVILSIAFSVSLCIFADLDIMEGFGYALSVPYAGEVCSGLVASLGANAVYDLVRDLNHYKELLATGGEGEGASITEDMPDFAEADGE